MKGRFDTNYKRNIYLMYAIALFQGMVFYGPIATLYRQAAGIGILEIAVIESISMAVCIGMELPWGMAADKIGYRKTMIVCCAVYALSKVVFWRANGFGAFLAERLMMSVVIAGFSGVDESILYLSDQEHAQTTFGIYNNLSAVGLLAASAVYTVWIQDDYRLAGFLTVVSYGVAAVLSLGIKEVKTETKRRRITDQMAAFGKNLRAVFGDPSMIFMLIAFALFNESHQTITVFLSQFQYVLCGFSSRTIGVLFMVMSILELTGGYSAVLTQKLGERWMINGLFLTAALACLILSVSCQPVSSVAALFALRICYSLARPLRSVIQNRRVQGPDRATCLSIHAVIIDSIAIVTNLIFGKLADIHLSAAMAAGAVFCFGGWLMFKTNKMR